MSQTFPSKVKKVDVLLVGGADFWGGSFLGGSQFFWGKGLNLMGVSLRGGTPISHPKMIIFSRQANSCWVPPLKETP